MSQLAKGGKGWEYKLGGDPQNVLSYPPDFEV